MVINVLDREDAERLIVPPTMTARATRCVEMDVVSILVPLATLLAVEIQNVESRIIRQDVAVHLAIKAILLSFVQKIRMNVLLCLVEQTQFVSIS